MSINFKEKSFSGRKHAIWREPKVLPGGFAVAQTFAAGTLLKRGTLVSVDMSLMKAGIVKIGKVLEGGTTTAPRVSKDNYLMAGDTVMKVGGNTSGTVASVDRSHEEYDVVTLTSAMSGLAAGDFLQEADTTGNSPVAAYTPNAVLAADRTIMENDLPTVDVAWQALVIRPAAQPFPDSFLTGNIALTNNHNILFINQ